MAEECLEMLKDGLVQRYGRPASTWRASAALGFDAPGLASLLQRRVIRDYLDQPVETSLLDLLLDVAFSAPSKSDYQQATVINVRDPGKRHELGLLTPAMPWVATAPAFLVFCADARRLEQVCMLRGRPKNNRNLEAFFNASVDAALVLQTFMIAATEVGLGTCPISVIRNRLDDVVRILALPPGVVPVAGLTVGYPASEGHISMRLPAAVTRAVDTYNDEGLEAALPEYDRRREERHPTPAGKQRDVAKFGMSEPYGWSEDKARHANGNEGSGFGRMVRAQGFDLD
jgi:nitroreductase